VSSKRTIKVLIAKPGLDGHDRGAHVLTMGLRDEGMEVIYTGLRQTPEMIASAALQEQPDVIGLSCLSGAHRFLFPAVVEALRSKGMNNIIVIGGGIIPPEDEAFLAEKGITASFGPGSLIKDIAALIRSKVPEEPVAA